MTRRVFKVGHIFKKIAKKLLWSYTTHKSTIFEHFQINLSKTVFFWSDDVIFNFFFKFFSKMRPSGHFVFYENLCSLNFFGRTSPRSCSQGSHGIWILKKKLLPRFYACYIFHWIGFDLYYMAFIRIGSL